jgi:hypothetical protein
MSIAELASKLDKLKLSAIDDWQKHEQSFKSTNKLLAQAYLNWREADVEPNWLENEYKKAGIKAYSKNNNQINYRPYIRLIYDWKNPTNYQNKITSHYAVVLNALNNAYNENEKYFQSNALGKLINYIEENGGVAGIVEERTADSNNGDDDEISGKDEKRLTKKKIADDELATRSINLLANSPNSIGTAKTGHYVRVDDNNLVALIGRKEADGTITILGTTNDEEAINATAIHATKRNPSLVPYNLRLISEVIHTQMFPRVGMPKSKAQRQVWRKLVWLDKTGFKISAIYKLAKKDIDPDNDELANPRSLLMRNVWEDVVFSALRSHRSVVTQCKPKTFIGDKTKKIYMKTNERGFIEDYIERQEIELMDASPKSNLQKIDDQKYIHKFTVSNKYTKHKKDFHFYERGRTADNATLKQQTEFHFFEFKPLWQFDVSVEWFESLRADWLDEWLATLGRNTQLKRINNSVFKLSITQKAIRITFNMDETGIAPSYNKSGNIKFNNEQKEASVVVRSKEFAPILYNIPDLAIEGSISISGNDDAIVFEFNTSVGEYKIAVPTYDKKLANSKVQRGSFYLVS